LTVALEDKPDHAQVLEVMKNRVRISSVLSLLLYGGRERIAALRIRTEDYKDIIKDLEGKGFDVLSIGKWPSI
jgi:hypothetical protein